MTQNNGLTWDSANWLERSKMFLEDGRNFFAASQGLMQMVNGLNRSRMSQFDVTQKLAEAQVFASLSEAAMGGAKYSLELHKTDPNFGLDLHEMVKRLPTLQPVEDEETEAEEVE